MNKKVAAWIFLAGLCGAAPGIVAWIVSPWVLLAWFWLVPLFVVCLGNASEAWTANPSLSSDLSKEEARHQLELMKMRHAQIEADVKRELEA